MTRTDRLFYLALPAVLALLAAWASIGAARDEGVVAGLASWAAFVIPVIWGAVGLALYSDAAEALNDLPKIVVVLGAAVVASVISWLAVSQDQSQNLILFVLGVVIGVFIFLQTPNEDSPLQAIARGPSSPGAMVFYTGVITGVGLLLVTH